jgi:hypothetical protein
VTLGIAVALAAPRAFAFCRTTTCDVSTNIPADCLPDERDQNQCSLKGAKLYWPSLCVSFGVQENGSKRFGISWELTDSLVGKAFLAWANVDCGGGRRPSLTPYDDDAWGQKPGHLLPIVCPIAQFNQSGPNANIWIYKDDSWPYSGPDALALTTVTFDPSTGRILDADVEINSFAANLTTSDTSVEDDLESIIMHETGHFLGLNHETIERATMNPAYQRGTTDFRTLEKDDVAGICTIYPPDRDAPDCDGRQTPLRGFTRYCADEADTTTAQSGLAMQRGGCTCSFDQSNGRMSTSSWLLAAGSAGTLAHRRRGKKGRARTR